jgi:hypothetical protein
VKLKSNLASILRRLSSYTYLGTFIVAAVVGGGSVARASVIFSNFGAGDSYTNGVGWTVSGPSSFDGEADQSMPFTAALTGNVSQIDLPLNFIFDGGAPESTHTGTISLWTDVNGSLGTQLGAWSVSVPNSGLVTVSGISGVEIDALGTYFLTASASGDAFDAWEWNSTGQQATFIDAGSNQFATLGAFDVLGSSVTATPLPSTWLMLFSGFAMIGFLIRFGTRKSPAAVGAA